MPAVPACVVSTGGAGDSLVAGAISQLLRGHSPQDALAFGMVRESFWLGPIAPQLVKYGLLRSTQAVASQALSVLTNVPPSLDAQQLQRLARETKKQLKPLRLPCKLLLPMSRL